MNALARKIGKILEETGLKQMSVHLLAKQCDEAGLNSDALTLNDLDLLVDRLEDILPFFIGQNAEIAVQRIMDLKLEERKEEF